MYSQVPAHDFPDLDLDSSPDESGCIDCLNVDFDKKGAVRVRDGFTSFISLTDTVTSMAPFYGGGAKHLLLARTGSGIDLLDARNTSGTSVATQAIPAGGDTVTFARFGTPTAQRIYASVGTSTSTGGGLIAVMPTDNRLAWGNASDGYYWDGSAFATVTLPAESSNRIFFSDAGDPATYGANNYVDLTPGDGEPLMAMCTWQQYVLAFKYSKFFVFYGNSTDSAGNPVFNYRPVYSGVGCVGAYARAVAPEGVYFVAKDGVYLTSGGAPLKISQAIDPLFTGSASSFFGGAEFDQSAATLGGGENLANVWCEYFRDRLYITYNNNSGGASYSMLVYDTRTEKWTYWAGSTWNPTALSTFRIGDAEELVFAENSFDEVMRLSSAYTDDNGTAIVSRYRTGFTDFGTDTEKRIVRSRLFGTGTPTVKWSRDFGSLSTGASAALGTSPAIDQREVDCDVGMGRLWSWQFGASSGAWTVYRAHHELDPEQVPDTKTT